MVSYDESGIKISGLYDSKLILGGEAKVLPSGDYTFSR